MSRFETSKFVRNPQTMNQAVLQKACDILGWKYLIRGNEFLITDINQNVQLHGEYALKVTGDIVSFNSYYLKNGSELVEELQKAFFPLNVSYSKQTIIQEFEKKGFTLKRDWDFTATNDISEHFYMVGETKMDSETSKRFEIEFSILNDGTIVSDSNYLPDDVNDLAHLAMDEVEELLGNKRVMTKKEIPVEYRGRITSRTEQIEKLKNKR